MGSIATWIRDCLLLNIYKMNFFVLNGLDCIVIFVAFDARVHYAYDSRQKCDNLVSFSLSLFLWVSFFFDLCLLCTQFNDLKQICFAEFPEIFFVYRNINLCLHPSHTHITWFSLSTFSLLFFSCIPFYWWTSVSSLSSSSFVFLFNPFHCLHLFLSLHFHLLLSSSFHSTFMRFCFLCRAFFSHYLPGPSPLHMTQGECVFHVVSLYVELRISLEQLKSRVAKHTEKVIERKREQWDKGEIIKVWYMFFRAPSYRISRRKCV